jgi:hypothetical protein
MTKRQTEHISPIGCGLGRATRFESRTSVVGQTDSVNRMRQFQAKRHFLLVSRGEASCCQAGFSAEVQRLSAAYITRRQWLKPDPRVWRSSRIHRDGPFATFRGFFSGSTVMVSHE